MRWVAGVLAISFIGCGSDHASTDAPPSNESHLKASIDLTGVIAFAIGTPSTLYAIHGDGMAVATTLAETTSAGDATENAKAVFDTPKYVAISFDPGGPATLVGGSTCQFVVIRKSDGALTCLAAGDGPPTRVVAAGDTLFVGTPPSATGGLTRIDMAAQPATITTIDDAATTSDRIDLFHASSSGAVLAAGSFGLRVFKPDGGQTSILTSPEKCQWYDAGHDTFYYGTSSLKTAKLPARTTVYSLDGAFASALAGEVTASGGSPDCKIAAVSPTQAYGWTNTPAPAIVELLTTGAPQCWHPTTSASGTCAKDADCNGTCIVGGGGCVGVFCCEGGSHNGESCSGQDTDCVGACNLSGAQHPLSEVTAIVAAVGNADQIYVQGTDAATKDILVRFQTSTATHSDLAINGEYTFTAMSLSATGDLTFAGQRYSDSANVIATCNATCTVLSATAPVLTALQRIN